MSVGVPWATVHAKIDPLLRFNANDLTATLEGSARNLRFVAGSKYCQTHLECTNLHPNAIGEPLNIIARKRLPGPDDRSILGRLGQVSSSRSPQTEEQPGGQSYRDDGQRTNIRQIAVLGWHASQKTN